MALPFYSWSRTALTNATADATINWAEGQPPSSVNDSARAMMASTAAYRDDVAGAITTGGTATAYTLTSYQVFSTLTAMNGQVIAFVPHATNANAVGAECTLNVDGLGAKSIRIEGGSTLPAGTLLAGTPYVAVYNNSLGAFYLHNMTNPYSVPLGSGMDYWGATTPNSCFAFPIGQQISQTTYATLYAVFGANKYGADGGGLFYLPDKTGRISAMKEAVATRLTSAGGGVDGATLGAVGGAQSSTLITANLPAYTPAGTNASIAVNSTVNNVLVGSVFSQSFNYAGGATPFGAITSGTLGGGTLSSTGTAPGFTGTAQGGTSTAFANVPPTIVCNYIIRIV